LVWISTAVLGIGLFLGLAARASVKESAPANNERAPEYLAQLVESADEVEISIHVRDNVELVTVKDHEWQMRLGTCYRLSKFAASPVWACIGTCRISARKDGVEVMSMGQICEGVIEVQSREVSGYFSIGKESDALLWQTIREKIPRDLGNSPPPRTFNPEVKPVVPPIVPGH
jgi:hypothetical protein